MSSPAESPEPSTSGPPSEAGAPAPAAEPAAAPNGANGAHAEGEASMWSAVDAAPPADFDEYAAEQEASKVFALWQLGPDLVAPAAASAQSEPEREPDVWGAAPATEKMEAPPAPVIAAAPVAAPLSSGPTGEYAAAEPELRLPEAKGTRNALIGAAAIVLLIVVGGGFAMFSGGPTSPPAPATPPTAAAPSAPAATPPAASPPAVATAPIGPAAAPIAVAPTAPAAAPVAVAPTAPAAVPVAVAPTAPEPAPVAAPPVAPAPPIAPAPVAPPAVATVAPVPAPAAVVPQPPAPPPAPPQRRIRVRTTPGSATLTLDGSPVRNPYDGRLPAGTTHTLVATAEGYQQHTETLTVGGDAQLTLRLERVPPPPRVAPPPRPEPPRAEPRTASTVRRRPASSIRPRARERGGSHGAGFVTESPY